MLCLKRYALSWYIFSVKMKVSLFRGFGRIQKCVLASFLDNSRKLIPPPSPPIKSFSSTGPCRHYLWYGPESKLEGVGGIRQSWLKMRCTSSSIVDLLISLLNINNKTYFKRYFINCCNKWFTHQGRRLSKPSEPFWLDQKWNFRPCTRKRSGQPRFNSYDNYKLYFSLFNFHSSTY